MKVSTGGTIPASGDTKRSERHGIEIHAEEASSEWGSDARDEFHHFNGSDASGRSRDGTEHGESSFPVGRLFCDEAFKARGGTREEGGHLCVHRVHGAFNHRFTRLHRCSVEGQSFFEKGCGVDDDVGGCDKAFCVVGRNILAYPGERDAWVEVMEALEHRRHPGFTNIRVGL